MENSKITLLPNSLLQDMFDKDLFPIRLEKEVKKIDCLIAESEKNGRKYLLNFLTRDQANTLPIYELNEHTSDKDIENILKEIKNNKYIGLISDQGLPCLADPGAKLIYKARANGFLIDALSGPSSIYLSLMHSGFCGQRFSFHGYLPKENLSLIKKIKSLEKNSSINDETIIFIEAPYRSDKLLSILKENLSDHIDLCIAINLTSDNQKVINQKIAKWKENDFLIGKNPTIFLLYNMKKSNLKRPNKRNQFHKDIKRNRKKRF